MKKGFKLSIAAAIAAASVTVFSGCIHDGVDSVASTTDISGKAVDGYISGATITYSTKSTTTDSNGSWTLVGISDSDFGGTSTTLSVTGGTDTSTNLPFEGTLTSVLPETTADTTVVITPISTLVQKYIANTSGTTIAAAKSTMATTLGLSDVSALDVDPVANIGTSSSQTVYKALLKVQKISEAMADAGVSDPFSELSKKVTSSTTSIDTVITNTLADRTVVTNSTLQSVLQATQKAITAAVASTTISSGSSLNVVAKTTEAATSKIEDAIKTAVASNSSADLTNAINTAKTATLTINDLRVAFEADSSANVNIVAATKIDDLNKTRLANQYDLAAQSGNFDQILEDVANGSSTFVEAVEERATDLNSTQKSEIKSNDDLITKDKADKADGQLLVVNTLTLGTGGTTLSFDMNTTNDINVTAGTLSNYYDVNFSDSNVPGTFTEQTVNLTIEVINSVDSNDKLTLDATGIKLSYNNSNGIKTTLPVGAKVTITEKLSSSSTTSRYELTLTEAIENSDFVFNLTNVLAGQSGDKTSINNGLTRMNTHFGTSGKTYEVNMYIKGLIFDELKMRKTSFSYMVNVN